jgi:hypothetical protein
MHIGVENIHRKFALKNAPVHEYQLTTVLPGEQ